MTLTKRLQHVFKPFKGTVFKSRLLPRNLRRFPRYFRHFPRYFRRFPGISTFFPCILRQVLSTLDWFYCVCAHSAQETFKNKNTHSVVRFPGAGGNLSVAILCSLNGGTVPVRNAQCTPQKIFKSSTMYSKGHSRQQITFPRPKT